MTTTRSFLSLARVRTLNINKNVTCIGSRNITIGTDMISSVISLQEAHPWYTCAEEGSNKRIDNEILLKDLFPIGKTVVVFGVPAPFTGTCTNQHYPSYKKRADEILASNCDKIVCYSVSDPYAMDGWQKALQNDKTKIQFVTDPDGTFAKAYGLSQSYDDYSLGLRSIRFSTIVVDGIVKYFRVVTNAETDADEVLKELQEMKNDSENNQERA